MSRQMKPNKDAFMVHNYKNMCCAEVDGRCYMCAACCHLQGKTYCNFDTVINFIRCKTLKKEDASCQESWEQV